MTKPSDFCYNSKYLTIPEYKSATFAVIFPSFSVPANSSNSGYVDIAITTIVDGTLPRFCFKRGTNNYKVGNSESFTQDGLTCSLGIDFANKTTIRIAINATNATSSQITFPITNFVVRALLFRDPMQF